jgi:hypothetical protein
MFEPPYTTMGTFLPHQELGRPGPGFSWMKFYAAE